LWGSVNCGQSLHGLHNTKSLSTPGLVDKLAIFIQRCCAFFCSAKVFVFSQVQNLFAGLVNAVNT